MSCEYARARISSLLDHGLEEQERRDTLAHLGSCGRCHDEYQAFEEQRLAMRSMGELAVPPVVTHRLRVLASHERLRQMARASISARLRHMADNARLFMDNMMRPVALPFGGGLISAMLLFGILAPGLSFTRSLDFDPSVVSMVTLPQGRRAAGEVVSVEMAGFVSVEGAGSIPSSTDSTLVELTVDRFGQVRDWRMVQGELTPAVKRVILYFSFNPGTYFGVPTDSKILVSLHSVPRTTRS
ncbi:MAG: zf-HC2 domain-containing protein [Bryobacteraceae bacterium]|jgi:anti-sigma factor RsiW